MLALRWEQAGRTPSQMHEARTVSLPKPGKARGGVLEVQQTRPITVLNVHWRMWNSARLSSSAFQEWLQATLPTEITGRRGYDVQQVAAKVLEDLAHLGYTLSLEQMF